MNESVRQKNLDKHLMDFSLLSLLKPKIEYTFAQKKPVM